MSRDKQRPCLGKAGEGCVLGSDPWKSPWTPCPRMCRYGWWRMALGIKFVRGGREELGENIALRLWGPLCLGTSKDPVWGRLGRGVSWGLTPQKHRFWGGEADLYHIMSPPFWHLFGPPQRVRAGVLNRVRTCGTHRWWIYLMCVWDGPACFWAVEYLDRIHAFHQHGYWHP